MAIYNLTHGKYPSLILNDFEACIYGCVDGCAKLRGILFSFCFDRLKEIPIFLVESWQSLSLVPVPGCQCAVCIPPDQGVGFSGAEQDASLYSRLRLWELENWGEELHEDAEDNKDKRAITVSDYLGVYISDHDALIPKRIFVWVNKIVACANGDIENASALLKQVVLHELAHAFLDVRTGNIHNAIFTYEHPAYSFIEESLANGISLHMCMNSFTPKQQSFIDQFIGNQGSEYSEGLQVYRLCTIHQAFSVGCEWRWAKVSFDKQIAEVIYCALNNACSANKVFWLNILSRGLNRIHHK